MASRKEEKQRLREQREAREREQAAAAGRRRRLGLVAAGVLVAAAAIALLVVVDPFGGGDGGGEGGEAAANLYPEGGSVPEPRETELDAAAEAAGCRVRRDKVEGQEHTQESVRYRANPPTSGDHDPVPAEDAVYSNMPPVENLVHTLEHGRIVVQFKPGTPAPVRSNLRALYDEDPAHVVLTPNETGMDAQIAATAWGNALVCPRVNDRVYDAVRAFRDRFRDRGPEFVP